MSHFADEEDVLDAENVGLKIADIGAKRPGRVLVSPHRSRREGRWTGIEHHERDYPDVWDHAGQWDEIGQRVSRGMMRSAPRLGPRLESETPEIEIETDAEPVTCKVTKMKRWK